MSAWNNSVSNHINSIDLSIRFNVGRSGKYLATIVLMQVKFMQTINHMKEALHDLMKAKEKNHLICPV